MKKIALLVHVTIALHVTCVTPDIYNNPMKLQIEESCNNPLQTVKNLKFINTSVIMSTREESKTFL